jgi:hypothetical protein
LSSEILVEGLWVFGLKGPGPMFMMRPGFWMDEFGVLLILLLANELVRLSCLWSAV